MNKHQLACQAALASYGLDIEGKQRMAHLIKGDKPFNANNILAREFGVSRGYIIEAKRLLKTDRERFDKVLSGEEFLPIVRPTKPKNGDNVNYSLYRVYDGEGLLLYIGKTWNMEQRMKDHSRNSKWWNEFATMTVDRSFNDYDELTKAETLAIRNEQPVYNLEAGWYR